MKIFHISFFLYVNFVATVVATYRRCYSSASFSLCLITNNTDDGSNWNNKFRLTRSAAEIWCRSQSSTLASITSETVQFVIQAFINDPSAKLLNTYILTNGSRSNLRNWEWINGRQSDYFVNATDPAVDYSAHRYAYLVASTNIITLFDSHANYTRKFICSYITQNSSCPRASSQFEGSCYIIYQRLLTWFDARNICLRHGSDLATFENVFPPFRSEWTGEQFWIGMRKEAWYWWNGQEIKYSNWYGWSPRSSGGDCLCLVARTGKWTNCDCSISYRYVCIQAIQMTTTTTKLKTTQSMTTSTPTLGDSSSKFQSTPIHTLDDDSGSNVSDYPQKTLGSGETSGFLPVLVGGIACLSILIIVIALIVCIKIRRGRSSDHEPTNENFPPSMTYKDDAPNTVYAAVVPNASEPVCSALEKNSNQTVYAELDLEPKRNIGPTHRTSNPGRFTSENTPSEAVYAEVNCLPKENMNEGAEGSSEYDNIQMIVDCVYANSAQTKV